MSASAVGERLGFRRVPAVPVRYGHVVFLRQDLAPLQKVERAVGYRETPADRAAIAGVGMAGVWSPGPDLARTLRRERQRMGVQRVGIRQLHRPPPPLRLRHP